MALSRSLPQAMTAATPDAAMAGLIALLKSEEAARQASSEGELLILAANDMMRLAKARQVFVIKTDGGVFKAAAVSSLAAFDPNAPLVQGIERLLAQSHRLQPLDTVQDLQTVLTTAECDPSLSVYPFAHLLWLPLTGRHQNLLGGLLLARDAPWSPAERVVPERLAHSFAHAWQALRPYRRWQHSRATRSRAARLALTAAFLALLIPVPMTTLAPFEVGSSSSFVIAAPIDGVIDEIAVEPNAAVKAGDVLVRLNGITLRNRLEIAEHEVSVAEARMTQTLQLAFGDARGRHDIGIVRAERALKVAERDYAHELLDKAQIKAPRDGLAVFADKRSLLGKPVATGERIMDLADPNLIELRIDVAVSDAISVRTASRLKAFFDADPLHTRAGTVTHADYQARLIAGDVLAYRVVAGIDANHDELPRLGSRGTAQLYGENVPLAYLLFRRPLTAVRQRFGL